MPSIRMHPSDCAKYGAPEVIEIDFQAIGLRQRAAVEKASKRPLRWMYDQLAGVPELDEHQNPIPIPVIDPETGKQEIKDGEPVFTPRLTRDPEAILMLVWMALWGIGIRTDWDAFDVVENGLWLNRSDSDDEEPDSGKGEEQPTDSESSTTS